MPNRDMKSELRAQHSDSSRIGSPKILAILPALMPSTVILVIEPLMHLMKLKKIMFRIRLENLYVTSSDLKWADLVIFCRNTEPVHDGTLERVLALKIPYIYELDDNFFKLPFDMTVAKYHRAPKRIAQLKKYIKNASLVRVYSLPLETQIKQYTQKVKYVKAPVNLDYIPDVPPHRVSRKLKLVYATSRTVSDNLSQILVKDLTRILKENSDNIEVHFWGFVPEELKGLPSVKFHRFMLNHQKYMQVMYKQGYDIGLAPMKNDLFYRSKTNVKFREYGACWIAGIYSKSEVYANCVEEGTTGLLISNKEGEWYKAINRLMHDVNLRHTIRRKARTVVEREYSLNAFALLLVKDLEQVLLESPKPIEVVSENDREQKINFSRVMKRAVLSFRKIRRSVKKNGYMLTFRLILEQIERYIEYFRLSWKLSWLVQTLPMQIGRK